MAEPFPQEAVAGWLNDPLAFMHYFWPDSVVYDKQEEILLSVRDNIETYVHAAHEMGKSWTAAHAVLWFFCTRFPAKVVTSSSSERQLFKILWAEIDDLIHTAVRPLDIVQNKHELHALDDRDNSISEKHYVVGIVTNTIESFSGHHLKDIEIIPRVLFVFDEGSGVPDQYYTTATGQFQRLLVLGNPLSTTNFFYRNCKRGDLADPDRPGMFARKIIHISGDDSPNVIIGKRWKAEGRPGTPPTLVPGVLSYRDYRHRERIWNPVERAVRLYGQFYEGEEYLMFPPNNLDKAEALWEEVSHQQRGPFYMGVDVAEGGRDLTCWVIVDRLGLVYIEAQMTPDTSAIPTVTRALMSDYDIPARNVGFDRGGGGRQHKSAMQAMGLQVRDLTFGASARDKKTYANVRAEIYGELAKSLKPANWSQVEIADEASNETGGMEWSRCFALAPEGTEIEGRQGKMISLFSPELREELVILPVIYDKFGKQFVLPKKARGTKEKGTQETIDDLIGRSPDRSDALAIANWMMRGGIRKTTPRVRHSLVGVPSSDNGEDTDDSKPRRRTLSERIGYKR